MSGVDRHPASGGYRHPASGGYRHPASGGYRHPASGGYRHRAFGLSWRSDVALDQFVIDLEPANDADIDVRLVDCLPERLATGRVNRGTIHPDGIRLLWEGEMLFDMIDGSRIDCLPGRSWSGALSPAFYATIAALTLAWRGAVPLHASAVTIDGRGIILCGASGAGKSTLTASLISQGAQFIGDDLTILWPTDHGSPAHVAPGRTAMRLHPETACWIDTSGRTSDDSDGRGKWQAVPRRRSGNGGAALAAIVMVGGGTATDLPDHLFRPRWMEALPGQPARLSLLANIGDRVPLIPLPAVRIADRADFDAFGKAAMADIRAALG